MSYKVRLLVIWKSSCQSLCWKDNYDYFKFNPGLTYLHWITQVSSGLVVKIYDFLKSLNLKELV